MQYIKHIGYSRFSTGTVNYLTLASFQMRRPHWRATITLSLSIPLSASFYFNESAINKEMEQLPKGDWFHHNGSLLLSMAVLNSPTRPLGHAEGHLQYRPHPPPPTPPPPYRSLLFLSSRSPGLICATVSFDPPPHANLPFPPPAPPPLFQMQTLQYFILICWGQITGHCMLGLLNDRAEGIESGVTRYQNFIWAKRHLSFTILCQQKC